MKSEYILKGRVHKSWIPLLIGWVIISATIITLACTIVANKTIREEWAIYYSDTKTFSTLEEASDFQLSILRKIDELSAKGSVTITKESPPTVHFSVTSQQPFPYGIRGDTYGTDTLRLGYATIGFAISFALLIIITK